MKNFKLFAILISAGTAFATSTNAQPPDVVQSDAGGNTAMGLNALLNEPSSLGGNYNTAAGNSALQYNTTGSDNIATGAFALQHNTTGSFNTAAGWAALDLNTTGSYNTAAGGYALTLNAGSDNTAFGFSALYSNTGSDNIAVGVNALYSNTAGSYNVAIGDSALYYSIYGYNTAIGYNALLNNVIGSNDVAIGPFAGRSIQGSNNIDIGTVGYEQASDNGVIRIGASAYHSTAYIAGVSTSQITGAAVYVNASGQLGVLASSERYKTAISPMGETTEKLQQLRPVTFHLKSEPDGALQYGLIAEEVDKIYPELVIRDVSGVIQGVRYDELAPMLLNEVQKQRAELNDMQHLKEQVGAQSALLQQVLQQLADLKKPDGSKHAFVSKNPAVSKRVAAR